MLYISVISHGHFNLIKELHCIEKLSLCNDIKVIVVDNLVEKHFDSWCKKNGIYYLSNEVALGFGENNNNAFNCALKNFDVSSDDFFLVLNPDVFIDVDSIKELVNVCSVNKYNISTINLYSSFDLKEFDFSIRKYPRLIDWLSSFLFGVNKTKINKFDINEHTRVDWGAGSFLMFTVGFYKKLKGFDENYYMYCEDIDICNRADIVYGEKLVYIPSVKAVHLARHKNKKILSKHFFWHLKSIVRYLFVRRKYRHE